MAVVGAVIAAFAFAALTVTSRAGLRTVLAIAVAVAVTYGTVGALTSDSSKGTFDRYQTISSPGEAVNTAVNYRSATLSKIPTYAAEYPLGAGFGEAGPAASVREGPNRHLDAESEPTFLLIELGLPGFLVMGGFFLALFLLSVTRIRRIVDRELRILLTGIAAPLLAIFATGYVGVNTTSTPTAPYLWFAAGIMAYWLLGEGSRALLRAKGVARTALVPAG